MKEIIIEAKIENLYKVMDFINSALDSGNCTAKLKNDINIAVEELFINVASYAYNSRGGVIVGIDIDDSITLKIADSGKPFNLLEKTDPDISKPIMEREIGGLGILMVKKLMDDISYEYIDNKNVLTLRKRIE